MGEWSIWICEEECNTEMSFCNSQPIPNLNITMKATSSQNIYLYVKHKLCATQSITEPHQMNAKQN